MTCSSFRRSERPITGTFGREDKDEKEKIFLISFGKSIDYEHIISIIKMLLPLGLEYIQCINKEFGVQYGKGIYIGAFTYGDKNEVTEIEKEIMSHESNLNLHNEKLAEFQSRLTTDQNLLTGLESEKTSLSTILKTDKDELLTLRKKYDELKYQ